jgi:hypothetical protein
MKEVVIVIGLAVGFAMLANCEKAEELSWEEQIHQSNEAGQEWEESHRTSSKSLTLTQR